MLVRRLSNLWEEREEQRTDLRRSQELWHQLECDLEALEKLLAANRREDRGTNEEIQRRMGYLQAGCHALEEMERYRTSLEGFISGRTLSIKQRIALLMKK